MFESTEVWKRQYELLVCEFLFDGFAEFMNNSDDKKEEDQIFVVYDEKETEYAHLLSNLINQSSKFYVIELTEKMFLDNAKTLPGRSKIIFLGNTKSTKTRSTKVKYNHNILGMRYGWFNDHCFINTESLKAKERDSFIKYYCDGVKKYEGMLEKYEKRTGSKKGEFAAAAAVGGGAAVGVVLVAPLLAPLLFGAIPGAGAFAINKLFGYMKNISDLAECQYRLLLIEFVSNGLNEFMEQ